MNNDHPRRASFNDIVNRDPITVSVDPARGYEAVHTTMQFRLLDPAANDLESGLDVAIHTEYQVGPRTRPRRELRELAANHHRELAAELLQTIGKSNT